MKSIKNAILPIVIGLVLFGIDLSIVMADVTYTYTGQKDKITSNKIVGSFTLPISLIPNEIYEYIPVSIFSFSDGKTRFTDRNTTKSRAGFTNGFWNLETDSKGDIKNWTIQLYMFDPEPPKVNSGVKALITAENWDQSYYGICKEVRNNNCYLIHIIDDVLINLDRAGTWKVTKNNASSSSQTGFQISKSGRFLEYGASFSRRVPMYSSLVVPTYGACAAAPIPANPSCYAIALETLGISLYEGYNISKIAFDPPDPLYFEIFQPRQYPAFTLDSSSGLPQGLIDTANAAFRDQTEMASLLEAWRVTLERYSAAQAANDQLNMLRQAAALDDYIIQTSRLATLVQQSFDEFLDQLEEFTGPVLISPNQMQEAMNNLAVNGFSQLVLDRLSSFGLGSAEIEELRSTLLQAPPLSDTVDFYSVMRSTEGSYGELSAITRYVLENNQPPVALCQDRNVSANGSCQANASVNNGAYDPDGDPITLTQEPSGPYGLGSTGVTLTATDSNGASASCSATVTVVDTTPPTITSVTVSPNTLWPPNHKMVPMKVTATTSDNCTVAPVCKIVAVTSNEPVNGTGDGDTAPDWEITGNLTVNLRAERSGGGSGRVYSITTQCADAAGNSSTPQSVTITVPHDQGKK